MASIEAVYTKNKHLSFKFRTSLGRDENGKQISKSMRWHPPEGMTAAKAKKETQRVAALWETEQLESFSLQKEKTEETKIDYTFGRFIDELWIPLCVRDGSHRLSPIRFLFLSVVKHHCNTYTRANLI